MLGMLIHKNGLPQILMILSYCMFTVKVVIYGGGGGRFALKLRIKLKTVKTTPTHPLPLYGKKIKTSVW